MVVNRQVNAGQMAMAGGSVSSADMSSFVSVIKDTVSSVSGGNMQSGLFFKFVYKRKKHIDICQCV